GVDRMQRQRADATLDDRPDIALGVEQRTGDRANRHEQQHWKYSEDPRPDPLRPAANDEEDCRRADNADCRSEHGGVVEQKTGDSITHRACHTDEPYAGFYLESTRLNSSH